ncbi:MAG TPA: acyl CoA:acetate/3-ketoacid CoA transferase [Dissulfurispiraceae bacterium]|nr:acyl CoA:acetate/3-ketoacid CoA transferase [Dissulfurispiraceae bacterium]
MAKAKIVKAEEAVSFIKDGDTVASGGFVGSGFAEEIAMKIEEAFLQSGKPRDLTLIYAAGQGDGKTKGLNHLGHDGLVKRVIGGHIGLAPKLQELIRENKCLAYNFPQGVVCHLFRDIAAKKAGTITHVGLGTFIDPREEGGKLNDLTRTNGDDRVELVTVAGREYLFYKSLPINVAIIRGTTADTEGNISIEKEALTLEILNIAMAAKNSCGIVIGQVERITQKGTLSPRQIRVPGILVDYVVQAKAENHWQTFGEPYSPAFSGQVKVPMQSIPPLELNERKIIARRAAFELGIDTIVNLGIGMPEGVSRVANEEGLIDSLTLTTEPGAIGGMPAGGLSFGASTNVDALISQPEQFDFYDGGGLDTAFLGAAEIDAEGNVNVSKFGPRFVGPGGFINISQNAKKVIFLSTFTAGGLKVSINDGKLKIDQEGKEKKLVAKVQQKTYSGKYGVINKQPVLYVTERCVFELTDKGVELTEVAPGIDIEKEILALMDFKPIMNNPKLMDSRIFRNEPMGIKNEVAVRPICRPEMK